MDISVEAKVVQEVNYAAIHCGYNMIENIRIEGESRESIICRITAAPEFIFEFKQEVPFQSGLAEIAVPAIVMADNFYRTEIIEAREGEIKIEILDSEDPNQVLGFKNNSVHVQPYTHWDGYQYPETMPAFSQPNDPLVIKVLKRAGEYAKDMGISMFGYQGRTTESIAQEAECIYKALQDMNLHYISAPASFETTGQKIRIPHLVLHEDSHQGTCLDLAVLYATCLEAAALHAAVIVIPGHAFAGVWMESDVKMSQILTRSSEISEEMKNVITNTLLPVECTMYTDGRDLAFEQAVEVGRRNLGELSYVIDVATAREKGMNPIYTYTDKPICKPHAEERTLDMESVQISDSKLDRLKKQAMDISLRNKLINSKKADNITCFFIETEKLIKNEYSEADLNNKLLNHANEKGISDESVNDYLHKLYLNNRLIKREQGEGNLYLAVNTLVWRNDEDKKLYEAPIYLCPAEITMNKRGEHLFHITLDEMRFNPVLKELLIQQYHIDISDLENMGSDEYQKQMDTLRYRIEKKKQWSVVENTAKLASFSIPNEAIWKGLSEEQVYDHELNRGILKGTMNWENDIADTANLSEEEVYAFQADSSQSAIVKSAFEKRAQVVVGPAGNGKTQTIANIMTEGMKRGKKILFVSEKVTALSVVKDMLESAGVGKFCLEAVSGKHSAREIAAQIEATLRFVEGFERKELSINKQAGKHTQIGDNIRNYAKIMSSVGNCDLSLEELLESYETYRECPLNLNWNGSGLKVDRDDAEDLLENFAQVIRYSVGTDGRYLEYLKFPREKEERDAAEEAVNAVLNSWERLTKDIDVLSGLLNITKQYSQKEHISKVITFSTILCKCPELGEDFVPKFNGVVVGEEDEEEKEIKLSMLVKLDDMRNSKPQGLKYNWAKKALIKQLEEYLGINKTRQIMRNTDFDKIETLINSLSFKETSKDNNESNARVISKQEQYDGYLAWCADAMSLMDKEEVAFIRELIDRIATNKEPEIKAQSLRVKSGYEEFLEEQFVAEKLVVSDIRKFDENYPNQLRVVLYKEWKDNQRNSQSLDIYKKVKKEATDAGLGSIVQQMEIEKQAGKLDAKLFIQAFRKKWHEEQIRLFKEQYQELRSFNHFDYQQSLSRYRDSEEKIRETIREEVLLRIINRLPNMQEGAKDTPELGRLNKLIRKKGKKFAPRTIFEQAPHFLTDLYPCVLMNPSAVAEYLPEDYPDFDIVIIDEGSQMPTYKALIPISHGNSCLIFGDEQQLTPTSFFVKQMEDEDGDISPMESILEDAIITSMPKKMLQYHYRSEKESLIAFSNMKYYNGDIITFPSSSTYVSGVSYDYVENGEYDRGGKKTNMPEALRVIDKIKELLAGFEDGKKENIGVITLNINQRDLIQSLLVKEAVENNEFGQRINELVDVVNLEACQGKEWDNVIISPAYGLDKNGNFTNNLGALGRDGGSNRLNVLITRSKKRMCVVSSLKPEMLMKAIGEGAQDFRDFLAYARGDVRYDTRETEEKAEIASMKDAIAAKLREEGYQVHTNIGSSKCKVDIGIVSKEDESKYVLGILLDHFKDTGRSVRDKEIIYPEALKRKGWNIYRLHALSWYTDMEYELQQIRMRIAEKEEA